MTHHVADSITLNQEFWDKLKFKWENNTKQTSIILKRFKYLNPTGLTIHVP